MATLAIAAAGAAIGGAAAYGTAYLSIGIAAGWLAGSMVGNLFLGAEGQNLKGPRLDDLKVQSSSYGAAIPEIYGSERISGNVIWSSDIKEHKHREDVDGGGKGGGGGSSSYTTYSYTCSWAMGLCAGEIDGIGRIWFDGKIWMEPRADIIEGYYGRDVMLQNYGMTTYQRSDKIAVYTGSESQEPDATIESYEGVGNVPAYRGTAYIVFTDIDLSICGNRIPNVTVEVYKTADFDTQYLYYNLTPTTVEWRYPTTLPDGNVLFCCKDHGNKQIYFVVLSGMTSEELYRFYPEQVGTKDYSDYDAWLCEGMCIRHGAPDDYGRPTDKLLTLWTQNGENWPEVRIVYHNDIAWDILTHKKVSEATEQWHWASFDGMSAQDHDIVLKQIYYHDAIIHLRTWDFPAVYNVIDIPHQDYSGILIHPWTYNLWLNRSNHLYEYYGISYNLKQTISRTYWNSTFTGFTYDHEKEIWMIIEEESFGQPKIYVYDNDINRFEIESPTYESSHYPTLASIVSSICIDAGLTSDEIDVTELANIDIYGYKRASVMHARSAIEVLQAAYNFDAAEIDNKIHFILRSGTSSATIADDDLGVHEYGSQAPDDYTTESSNEMELPASVEVRYIDPNLDFQTGSQRYDVYFTASEQKLIIDLPIVMTANDALQIANKILMQIHAGKHRYQFQISRSHINLSPADVITVDNNIMRIASMQLAGGLIGIEAISEWDATIYTSSLEAPDVSIQPYLPKASGNTEVIFLDIPILSYIHDNPGFYIACYYQYASWHGATIAYSIDGGASWIQSGMVSDASTAGRTRTKLDDADVNIWDNINNLSVNIFTLDVTLSSSTEENVLNGVNLAAVGNHGRWELIRFVDAVLESDGSYTLSGFLRGLYGTESNTANHETNDIFVMLDINELSRIPLGTADIDIPRNYRAVSIGQIVSDARMHNFTNTAIGLKPYSVCHVRGVRNVSEDLAISWVRRDRIYIDDEWGDYASALRNSEDDESYEIDILDGSTVVRTIEISDAVTTTYTAAQQTVDFGAPQSSIDIEIYQMSAARGRGRVKEATL